MPLYNTATHNSFTRHRPASGTNIHTAYSTVHVATSVPVAALHKMTAGLCVVCVRMYLCSPMSVVECAGGGRGWERRVATAVVVVEVHHLPIKNVPVMISALIM